MGTAIGVLGIVLAVVFYMRSRRKTALAYQTSHVTLVGGRGPAFPDEVEIRFSGTVVQRVTTTRVVLWNSGNQTVYGQNIVTLDPLRIELSADRTILKTEILREPKKVNGWKVTETSPSHLRLEFDYLEPRDGLVLKVTHSGSRCEFRIAGTIQGIPAGLNDLGSWNHRLAEHLPNRFTFRILPYLAYAYAVVVFGFSGALMIVNADNYESTPYSTFTVAIFSFLAGMALWFGRHRRTRYPTTLDVSSE